MSLCEKDYVFNPATCNCENGKYLASILDDSAITCDEIIKTCHEETSLNEKKATQNVYILIGFLLITMVLLIAVRIYCYLIKY